MEIKSISGNAVSGEDVVTIETLIVGGNFSAIPLVRELEKEGKAFIIIADGYSIWERLEKSGRLDFDLVSSKQSSMYSFELVNHDTKDVYPTSKEFLSFHRKYFATYQRYFVKDWVTEVHNYDDFSLVYTRSGKIYRATHVMIATAFRRKIHDSITNFDFGAATNKTIAFTAYGDSANLIVSKLMPGNNRVVLLTNGFVCLDKLAFFEKDSYTLDQLEMHNFRYVSKFIYKRLIGGGFNFSVMLPKTVGKWFFGETLHVKYPMANRNWKLAKELGWDATSPVPNGYIVIKYWPIDAYQRLYDDGQLEQHIEDGYLMNDIGYFVEQGKVDLWSKSQTTIDTDTRTIKWGDKIVQYDALIEGDREMPNLPLIISKRSGSMDKPYEYVYRDNFMGIAPRELKNIYLVGYTRPTSGGLNNIIEMQCLFVHRMITDKSFNDSIYQNIEERIKQYDIEYYGTAEKRLTDHLVFYGFYTHDLAKLIGIAGSSFAGKSLKDIFKYYLFPNNAFKYRQEGKYKVDGVKEMVEKIWQEHSGFSLMKHYILNYLLMQVNILAFICLLPMSVFIKVPLSLLFLYNPFIVLVVALATNLHRYLNLFIVCAMVATCFYPGPLIPGLSLLAVFATIFIGRKAGITRIPFNDLKNKSKYHDFFKRYSEAFNRVAERKKSTAVANAVLTEE